MDDGWRVTGDRWWVMGVGWWVAGEGLHANFLAMFG